jgi:hypothetical protein
MKWPTHMPPVIEVAELFGESTFRCPEKSEENAVLLAEFLLSYSKRQWVVPHR